MRPIKPALYFVAGITAIALLWLLIKQNPGGVFQPASKSQTPETATKAVVKDLSFTNVEFPFTKVKRGESLTMTCRYNNSLGVSLRGRAEISVYEPVDKVKAKIFTEEIGTINQGDGVITLNFPVPKKISPGEYKAILDVYLMPDDKLKGGCGTDRFTVI